MNKKINIFWFRRDLRLHDNAGLYQALSAGLPVLAVFIFDKNILGKLNAKDDARVTFIHSKLKEIQSSLEQKESSMYIVHDFPLQAIKLLLQKFEINAVFTNKDYEPESIKRDNEIAAFLKSKGVGFNSFKDHVIFEEREVLKENGEPYTVFTPYSRKWKQKLEDTQIKHFPSEDVKNNFLKTSAYGLPDLNEIGFKKSELKVPAPDVSTALISNYESTRNIPALNGTSRLGVHLRFGAVSIREITRKAREISETFLNELIWRNFFIDILWHFPHVVDHSFKPKYDFIEWRNNEAEFEKWCRGETGFPMVDAGMRELNETGFMHNRVRMITASFLVKDLLIDWRWGEAYFAEKLLDYELASNNGNWQWAAGCGCDAAPYFRVFNPDSQQQKFDPKRKYILKWIPEYGTMKYPQPMVDHKFARERVLTVFKNALK